MYKNWDIIKPINGHENKVKYHIETNIRNSTQKDNIGEKISFIEGLFKVFYGTIDIINKEKHRMFITVIILKKKLH